MIPAEGALISVSIFIASNMRIVASASIESPSEAIVLKIFPPRGASIIVPSPASTLVLLLISFTCVPSLIVTELSAFRVLNIPCHLP